MQVEITVTVAVVVSFVGFGWFCKKVLIPQGVALLREKLIEDIKHGHHLELLGTFVRLEVVKKHSSDQLRVLKQLYRLATDLESLMSAMPGYGIQISPKDPADKEKRLAMVWSDFIKALNAYSDFSSREEPSIPKDLRDKVSKIRDIIHAQYLTNLSASAMHDIDLPKAMEATMTIEKRLENLKTLFRLTRELLADIDTFVASFEKFGGR